MRIEKTKKSFKEFSIVIESQAEFLFLVGLLNGAENLRKRNCDNYDSNLNSEFWRLLTYYRE